MKKLRILLLLLVPTLLSTSCSEGVLSSHLSKPSDSSSPSEPSTLPTPETTPQSSSQASTSHVSKPDIKGDDFTAQDIYEQLNFAGVANNYTINYDYKSVSYEDVFTQDYFYYGISNTGYMLLESYENSKERLAYSFSLINHEVKNLSAMATIGLDGSLVKINDLTKVDPLTYIEDDPSLASEIIPSSTKNIFYSTSVNLKNALSNALNISSSEVNSVNLVMDKDLNIGFSLIKTFPVSKTI